MATAAAHADDVVAGDVVPKKGKKKLLIIIAAVLLLALLGAGGAVYVIKQKAAAAEEDGGDDTAAAEERRKERREHPPTFVALEAFVVNLADKETDRFAQIGVTLEVEDAKFAEEMKAYMPAIRNGILMVLAHKTSQQLLQREGKIALAREIMREAVLPMGIEASAEEPPMAEPDAAEDADAEYADDENADADADAEEDAPRKRKKASVHNPVKAVHFSNFIVQ